MYGEVPVTRFRHTVVVITPEPTSKISILVNEVLHPVQHDAAQGSVVLLFGGYNTMGQEFGGDQFEVCCAQVVPAFPCTWGCVGPIIKIYMYIAAEHCTA